MDVSALRTITAQAIADQGDLEARDRRNSINLKESLALSAALGIAASAAEAALYEATVWEHHAAVDALSLPVEEDTVRERLFDYFVLNGLEATRTGPTASTNPNTGAASALFTLHVSWALD